MLNYVSVEVTIYDFDDDVVLKRADEIRKRGGLPEVDGPAEFLPGSAFRLDFFGLDADRAKEAIVRRDAVALLWMCERAMKEGV